jgi:hypothetical protein
VVYKLSAPRYFLSGGEFLAEILYVYHPNKYQHILIILSYSYVICNVLFHVVVITLLRWFCFFYNIFLSLIYLTFVSSNTEDGYMAGRSTLDLIVYTK